MPADGHLYVTYGDYWEPDVSNVSDAGWSLVDVLSLEGTPQFKKRIKVGPTNAGLAPWVFPQGHLYEGLSPRYPGLGGTHSVYVEPSNTPEPSIWVTQEDGNPVTRNGTSYTTSRVGAVRFSHDPTGDGKFREATRMVVSDGHPVGYLPSRIHYIRGVGRVGFVAHYNDGVDLVDLAAISDQSGTGWFTDSLGVLGSYDTSYESDPLSYRYLNTSNQLVLPNQIQKTLDSFLGCWDVYPHQDSGLISASCGQSGFAVMQVREGVLNRFGQPTPFAAGSASPGRFPRLVLKSGPARQGRQLVICDGNKSEYAVVTGGVAVRYLYKLRYAVADQFAIDNMYVPFSSPAPVPATGTMYLTTAYVELPFSESDVVITAPLPTRGIPVFGQVVVQEQRLLSGQWQSSGYWAASRGTWCGVGKP
jgi:hypothetical protein